MPVSEIIEACGGYTQDTVRLISGGPMMGKTIVNDMFVVDRAMNALTVLPAAMMMRSHVYVVVNVVIIVQVVYSQ